VHKRSTVVFTLSDTGLVDFDVRLVGTGTGGRLSVSGRMSY